MTNSIIQRDASYMHRDIDKDKSHVSKKEERKTKVGDLIVRNNNLYKVVGIKKDKNGERIFHLRAM